MPSTRAIYRGVEVAALNTGALPTQEWMRWLAYFLEGLGLAQTLPAADYLQDLMIACWHYTTEGRKTIVPPGNVTTGQERIEQAAVSTVRALGGALPYVPPPGKFVFWKQADFIQWLAHFLRELGEGSETDYERTLVRAFTGIEERKSLPDRIPAAMRPKW